MLEILCWDCSPFQWNLWKWNPVSHSLCHPFPSWFQHRAKFGSNNPHQLLTVWSVGLPYRYNLGDCPLLPPTDAEYNLYQGFPNCNVPYNNLGVLVKMQMCIQLFSHRAQDSAFLISSQRIPMLLVHRLLFTMDPAGVACHLVWSIVITSSDITRIIMTMAFRLLFCNC